MWTTFTELISKALNRLVLRDGRFFREGRQPFEALDQCEGQIGLGLDGDRRSGSKRGQAGGPGYE